MDNPVVMPAARIRKVAVASTDGARVDQCFGRAWTLRIYELADGEYRLCELRASANPCRDGSHDDDALEAAVARVADCDAVLAGRIGPGAAERLWAHGVTPLTARIGIPDALRRLALRAGLEETSR